MKYLSRSDHHHFRYYPRISTPLIAGIMTSAIISAIISTSAIAINLISVSESFAQGRNVYKPTAISSGSEINDILTDKDIPTGQKGFARDYILEAQKDERLEITVNSGSFDTVLSLLDTKGEVIAENDDAASDTTNSLIFFKVRQSGTYTIRVSSFGGSSGGKYTLKVTKLRVVN